MIREIGLSEVKEMITNKETFVLDIYANWCGPCRIMLKNLPKLESKVKFEIIKLNVESDKDNISKELTVRSLPTLIFYKEGVEVYRHTGMIMNNKIVELIDKLL